MEQSNENSPGGERPIAAHPLSEAFQAVLEYNKGQNILGGVMQRMSAEQAVEALVEQGIEREDAERNVAEIEGKEEVNIDFELLKLIHGTPFEDAGLWLGGDQHRVAILLANGGKFSDTLESLKGCTDESLKSALETTVEQEIDRIHRSEVGRHGSQLAHIFGGDVPDWVMIDPDEEPEEATARTELLSYAKGIATGLEQAGCSPETALAVSNIGAFEREGTLSLWAIAAETCVMPEVYQGTIERHNTIYYSWNKPDDWEPLFTILEIAPPGSRFNHHLRNNITRVIEQSLDDCDASLRQSFEDYCQFNYDVSDEDNYGDLIITKDELRERYESNLEEVRRHRDMLAKVQARL